VVEIGTIREEGFAGVPLLLGANYPTETVTTAILSADREEKVTAGNMRSSGDAIEFYDAALRPAHRLATNLMFEIAITKYLGRTHRVSKVAHPNNRLHASRLVASRP
jgi:hypothetical protein